MHKARLLARVCIKPLSNTRTDLKGWDRLLHLALGRFDCHCPEGLLGHRVALDQLADAPESVESMYVKAET